MFAGAASVEALADEADARLEGIDTWIYTAAVLVAGRLVDVPAQQIGRAVATNEIGMTLCSRRGAHPVRATREWAS